MTKAKVLSRHIVGHVAVLFPIVAVVGRLIANETETFFAAMLVRGILFARHKSMRLTVLPRMRKLYSSSTVIAKDNDIVVFAWGIGCVR